VSERPGIAEATDDLDVAPGKDEQEPRRLAAGFRRSDSAPSPLCKAMAASCEAAEVAARLREPIHALPQVAYKASPALACIIGARLAWTVEMISSDEMPCR